MGRFDFCRGSRFIWVYLFVTTIPLFAFSESVQALTASYGHPYRGRLENGIPFPAQFSGYQLREKERIYTTPEVAGAVLDAVDAVQKQFPGTCDLYIGDFSLPNGGFMNRHKSHQNGRDVDLGMYAKGNRTLSTFIPMTEENLDVARTWCLIENIIRSQRVQYIFLDKNIQKLLYDHALSRGMSRDYLDRIFGNARGAVIRHLRNHQDHIHVRFFAPWSTLASKVGEGETQKRTVIEMAQQAYLPKKVFYYAKGTERNLDTLAQSFGVNRKDLCRWNSLRGNELLTPGSCLVFYKRGFEQEPVHLAESLQPDSIIETPVVKLASLRPSRTISDVEVSVRSSGAREKKVEPSAAVSTYSVRKGDTLEKIAKRNGMDLKALCELNGIKRNAVLRPGQKVKVSSAKLTSAPVIADSQKPMPLTIISKYTAAKGDTLQTVAKVNGMDLDALCKLNGMKKNDTLKPGRQLKLAMTLTTQKRAFDTKAQASPPAAASKGSSKPAKSAKSVSSDQKAKASKLTPGNVSKEKEALPAKAGAPASGHSQPVKAKIATASAKIDSKTKPASTPAAQKKVKDAPKASSQTETPGKVIKAKAGGIAKNTKQSIKRAAN